MFISFNYKKNEYDKYPLMLTLLGKNHIQEPVYRIRGITMHQIFICKEGKGELIVENKKYLINKNQCFVILKGVPHEYRSLSEKWVLDIVGFNGSIVPQIFKSLKIDHSGAYFLKKNKYINKHINNFIKIDKLEDQRKNMLLSQELYCFLTDLHFELGQATIMAAANKNAIINDVINYIETHYMEDISVDFLAEKVSRTPEHLCSIFKKNTEMTIVKYINTVRLLHASILLVQEPSVPIKEIALRCGFRSASYFGALFVKNYHMTPNQYRMM